MAVHSRVDLLRYVAVIIACASVADLVWGGTFTYIVRVAARLLVLLAMYLAVGRSHLAARLRPPSDLSPDQEPRPRLSSSGSH